MVTRTRAQMRTHARTLVLGIVWQRGAAGRREGGLGGRAGREAWEARTRARARARTHARKCGVGELRTKGGYRALAVAGGTILIALDHWNYRHAT